MPSVRYAPTSRFSKHSSGNTLERVRFIIIDDDLNSAFCPTNLAALFGDSEKYKRYRLPQPDVGTRDNGSPVDSNRQFNANIKQKGSCLHRAVGTDIGGQNQNGGRGKELLASLHACYHQSQVSNITKFVCWSHGPTKGYVPQITLLFKEGTNSTSKFDWQQSPLASVFMCNKNGGVERLAFGDAAVSGLEFVSLGKPVGNFTSNEDGSSFISLIPGSDRADDIFDTLMDKTKNKRSQIDDSAAILSSSQSTDEDCLMMKKTFTSKKTSWTNRHANINDSGLKLTDKQPVKSQDSCQPSSNKQPKVVFHPENPLCRALTWLPSNIPMATKFSTRVGQILPGNSRSLKRAMKPEDGNLALVTVVPGAKAVTSLGKLRIEEPRGFRKAYERLPGLCRTRITHVTALDSEAMSPSGNDISINSCSHNRNGQMLIKEQGEPKRQELDELKKIISKIHNQKLITDGRLPSGVDRGDGRQMLPNTSKPAAENMQVVGYRKVQFFSSELRKSKYGPDTARVSGGGAPAFPLGRRSSKLDRGAPLTRIRTNGLAKPLPLVTLPTPPATPVNEFPDTEDPVFKGCKIKRGFDPVYPNGVTPKKVFQNRIGGLENWYTFPMVQVAREFLPEGMKNTDWSWTDNDVSGEFIPGGVAW